MMHYRRLSESSKGLYPLGLFRDNTLFEGNQLKGILDFYELNKDEFLFDIAITLNDFCTEYPSVHLNEDKAIAFLNAYESIASFNRLMKNLVSSCIWQWLLRVFG